MRFIDRSNVNGTGDNYKQAGVTHLYLKVSEGTTFTDPDFQALRKRAVMQGVKAVGGYHFARPDERTDPVAEAEHFLSLLGKPAPGQLRPCLDLERGSESADVAWAEKFVSHVRAKLGYWPVLYGSTSFIAPMRKASKVLRACPWWRAEYGPNSGRLYPLVGGRQGAAAHQYTSVAQFPGIVGDTDASVMLVPTAMVVPAKRKSVRIGKKAWLWAQWFLSIGVYKGRGRWFLKEGLPHAAKSPYPKSPPNGWRAAGWYLRHMLNR